MASTTRIGDLARHTEALREDVGRDQARADAIDADLVFGQLRRRHRRHMDDRRLGDGIEDRPIARLQARDRGRRDDRAAARLLHRRHGIFHPEQGRAHMQMHDRIEAFRGHAIGRIARAPGAGIVEEDVELAEFLLGRGHRARRSGFRRSHRNGHI